MYDLTDIASYKSYWENLASDHKLITSFTYGDQDVQNAEAITWEGTKLWLWPYGPVRVVDNLGDNYMQQKEGSVFVGGPEPEAYEDQDTRFNQCETIVKQLISRMLRDRAAGTLITRVNNWTFERSEIDLSTKMIGYQLRFFFDDPTGFEYNENDWNP